MRIQHPAQCVHVKMLTNGKLFWHVLVILTFIVDSPMTKKTFVISIVEVMFVSSHAMQHGIMQPSKILMRDDYTHNSHSNPWNISLQTAQKLNTGIGRFYLKLNQQHIKHF